MDEEDLVAFPCTSLQIHNFKSIISYNQQKLVSSSLMNGKPRHLEEQYNQQKMLAVLQKIEDNTRVEDCKLL